MKVCAACCNELPQEKFSKKQWKLKQHQRRCADCVAADKEVQPRRQEVQLKLQPSNKDIVSGDEAPSCYICLEDGPDETGGEVRRDCSCRGGSGYVHLSCIANYAEQKYNISKKVGNKPWTNCPNCNQRYLNEFAIDLARECVACMKRKFKHIPLQNIDIIEAQCAILENINVLVLPNPYKNIFHSEIKSNEAKQIAPLQG